MFVINLKDISKLAHVCKKMHEFLCFHCCCCFYGVFLSLIKVVVHTQFWQRSRRNLRPSSLSTHRSSSPWFYYQMVYAQRLHTDRLYSNPLVRFLDSKYQISNYLFSFTIEKFSLRNFSWENKILFLILFLIHITCNAQQGASYRRRIRGSFFSGRYPVGRIIQGVPAIYPSTAPIFPASPGKGRRGVSNCSGSNPQCCLEKRREGRLPPARFDSSVHDIHQCYTVGIDPLSEGIKAVHLKERGVEIFLMQLMYVHYYC